MCCGLWQPVELIIIDIMNLTSATSLTSYKHTSDLFGCFSFLFFFLLIGKYVLPIACFVKYSLSTSVKYSYPLFGRAVCFTERVHRFVAILHIEHNRVSL